MIPVRLLPRILPGYPLPIDGLHGVGHWARVLENGLRLAERTGADVELITLFAILHDARRVDEYADPAHGERATALACTLRNENVILLDDTRFDILAEACRWHTHGRTAGDITVQTCWDADRLDLGRVGIRPDPARLCTGAARDTNIMRWAHRRACREVVPAFVREQWGIDLTPPFPG